MLKRLKFALPAALMVMAVLPAVSSAPASTLYSFEECNQGWKFAESDATNAGPEWTRQPGGADESPLFAFRQAPYPQALGNGNPDEESYESTLTSPLHVIPAPGKVTYFVRHNLEEVPQGIPGITGGDFLYTEYALNGGNWVEVHKVTNVSNPTTTFVGKEFDVPAGSVQIRFRLYSDNNTSGEGGTGGEIAVDHITVPSPSPAAANCGGGGTNPPPPNRCTKSGTGKSETLRGTAKKDVLCAKGGNDKVLGRGNNDRLEGGAGKDTLVGGPGKDTCIGGKGRDTFKGCETKKQ